MRPDIADYFERYRSIPGWFFPADFRLFDFLLSSQAGGDLAEIGVYKGASAILLGLHLRAGETFTVCDLFGLPEADAPNRAESESLYCGLTREAFEQTYLSVLSTLPVILQTSSLGILDHVRSASCRFVHIDGSHLYDFVRSDLQAAQAVLQPDGIVAVDDWCSWDTPGVGVALMEQVAARELHAIAITSAKFYGSWNESLAIATRTAVADWAAGAPDLELNLDPIRDEHWPRITVPAQPLTARQLPHLAVRRLQRLRRRFQPSRAS